MMLFLLLCIPISLGLLTLLIRGEEKRPVRRRLLMVGATFHLIGTVSLYFPYIPHQSLSLLKLDSLGLFFLSLTSFIFFLVSLYSFGYFFKEEPSNIPGGVRHLYSPCMLFALAAMTLTTITTHFGLLWVAIEATTLATAPLIYYHHHERALEATWKYLLICSVGIALALLGIFFFAASGRGLISDLFVEELITWAYRLDPHWIKLGFILILVGFGTKMGLAPMHNWLPDAHSEAPSPVSALLSGALLNSAFLGILRCYQVCQAAHLEDFANKLLIFFGLISLCVATVFITSQKDFKRLLAYSSVEHMGILALGIGVGSHFGGLLHVMTHSLTKTLLFLVAGHIVLSYRTKKVADIHGLLKTWPLTGFLFIGGGLAIMGSPPFALFVSEFLILRDGLLLGHPVAMSMYLVCLGIIFVSMSKIIFGMAQGEKRTSAVSTQRYRLLSLPSLVLFVAVLLLGLYLPNPLVHFLQEAATLLGGQ